MGDYHSDKQISKKTQGDNKISDHVLTPFQKTNFMYNVSSLNCYVKLITKI